MDKVFQLLYKFFISFLFFPFFAGKGILFSQITYWQETFNNSCTANCLANGVNTGNGAWSVTSLAAAPGNGNSANEWYVSCAENGHTNTICGSGCVASSPTATLASLHVGSTTVGDAGAAYDAGGVCPVFYCTNTHKQVTSPLISTLGRTGISVSLDYIEFGETTNDDMYAFQYSTDGGATWVTLVNTVKTACCGGACNGTRQGQWTTYTSGTLPVAAENISNFRLSFIWKNNDDGIGTDPSFAVDNLKVRCLGGANCSGLPIELSSFEARLSGRSIYLKWITMSETNNDFFTVQRTSDGVHFTDIVAIKGAGNSSQLLTYSATDDQMTDGVLYYRLKQTDFDGKFTYSDLVAVSRPHNSLANVHYDQEGKKLYVDIDPDFDTEITVRIFDATGRELMRKILLPAQNPTLVIETPSFSQGVYYLEVSTSTGAEFKKIFL